MTEQRAKTKVAVLGGGPGGIAAAFWLTATPELRDRFDVTVHTLGWRLGGKCASGRNQDEGSRIEEHGLHVLMGCYHDAFAMIRACYDEWRPRYGCPITKWTDAFTAVRSAAVQEYDTATGSWSPWTFRLPEVPGWPGDDDASDAELVAAMCTALLGMLDSTPALNRVERAIYREVHEHLRAVAQHPVSSTRAERDVLADALLMAAERVGHQLRSPAQGVDADLVHLYIVLGLGFSAGRGWLTDLLCRGDSGIDAINELDFRAWLASHGAPAIALDSAPIKALYDLTFAYRRGDAGSLDNGSMAAGVTWRFVLDLVVGYRHAPFWKMKAGTGDVIFTPLYQVLTARGVTIDFFHRVTSLALTPDGSQLETIGISEQATTVTGSYQPLVEVLGLDCWPDRPLWDQLVGGAALGAAKTDFEHGIDPPSSTEIELRLGVDFDSVVLAIPPAEIERVWLRQPQDDSWQNMLINSHSVATAAFQRWLAPPSDGLGWSSQSDATIVTAYVERFDSWADMSQQLSLEDWPEPGRPRSIAYFCGCLPDGTIPHPPEDAEAWLARSIAPLWPDVVDPDGELEPGIVTSCYDRANTEGYERYVQTPAGSVKYRLRPDTAYFGNLYVAGDWTLTRYSGGCFESAIESGRRAAEAIAAAR